MSLSTALRDNLLAGLVLVAPLVVTGFALRILFGWVSAAIDPKETATEPSTDGSTTRDTDEPTSETVQRRVSLAEADDTERECDLRIESNS